MLSVKICTGNKQHRQFGMGTRQTCRLASRNAADDSGAESFGKLQDWQSARTKATNATRSQQQTTRLEELDLLHAFGALQFLLDVQPRLRIHSII